LFIYLIVSRTWSAPQGLVKEHKNTKIIRHITLQGTVGVIHTENIEDEETLKQRTNNYCMWSLSYRSVTKWEINDSL